MWKSCLVHPCIQPASGDAELRGKQQGGNPHPPHTHNYPEPQNQRKEILKVTPPPQTLLQIQTEPFLLCSTE